MRSKSSSYEATKQILRLQRRLRGAVRGRLAVNDLAQDLGVDRRTIIRWADLLDGLGAAEPDGDRVVRETGADGRAWLRLVRANGGRSRGAHTVYQLAAAKMAADTLGVGEGNVLADCGLDVVRDELGEHDAHDKVLRQGFLAHGYDPRRYRDQDQDVDRLLRAVVQRRRVRFARRAFEGARMVTYEPWTLLVYRESLYMYGMDVVRGAMRTWAVTRMGPVELLAERFVVPDGYDPREVFAGRFGIYVSEGSGEEPVEEIVVRFTPWVAKAVQTRALANAEWIPLDDGGVELWWTVPVTPEVVSWVLGWGPEAEVVAPVPLRARVGREATRCASVYLREKEEQHEQRNPQGLA